MLKHYFKTAWRSFGKNKLSAFINVFGLTLGVACFFILATYILNELRYDKFNTKADRIVMASMYYKSPSDPEAVYTPNTPTALAPTAKRISPQVENAVRIYNSPKSTITIGDKNFIEKNMRLADKSFFDIFSLKFLEGNPKAALANPNSVVLTESAANKYFGKENSYGKTLKIGNTNWLVTGIIKDIPSYSSVTFDMLGSYSTLARSKNEIWNSANDRTFLLLKSPEALQSVQTDIKNYLKKTFPEEYQSGSDFGFLLEPLLQIHLHSKTAAEGNITYLYIFGLMALLLLLCACINFTNLLTAKSIERAKEIGVRKVFGAARSSVFLQFIFESGIITAIAIIAGASLAFLIMPVLNTSIGIHLSIHIWSAATFIFILLLVFIGVTFAAGTWPAYIISKYNPAFILKNQKLKTNGTSFLRKALIIFQFTVSIAFMVCTLIAYKQMHFIQNTNTGIDRSQVIVLDGSRISQQKLDAFKGELLKNSSIKNVSASYDSPVDVKGGYTISVKGFNQNNALSVTAIPVDIDYVKTLGIKINEGSDLTQTDVLSVQDTSWDKREYAFMLNRKAVQALGLTPATAINKEVEMNGRKGRVKAVLNDFNFASLREAVQPIVVFPEYDYGFGETLIKTAQGKNTQALAVIEKTWKKLFPNQAFEYHFLDEEYSKLYETESRTSFLLNIFSIVTILISCLGLFGLAAFSTSQRIKEIGVRKVLGASVPNIVLLLSKDFLKLILIAIIIASAIGYWAMNKWLRGFAFKTNISGAIFILSSVFAIAIAFAAISYYTIRAARANPVKSLKTE